MKIHHIGYLVKNISKAKVAFEKLGFSSRTNEPLYDPGRALYALFLDNSNGCVELIEPTGEGSPVWEMAKKYRNMPYHLCFETNDINDSLINLAAAGYLLITPLEPAPAIGCNAIVAFLVNKDAGMVELVQVNK